MGRTASNGNGVARPPACSQELAQALVSMTRYDVLFVTVVTRLQPELAQVARVVEALDTRQPVREEPEPPQPRAALEALDLRDRVLVQQQLAQVRQVLQPLDLRQVLGGGRKVLAAAGRRDNRESTASPPNDRRHASPGRARARQPTPARVRDDPPRAHRTHRPHTHGR